MTRKILAATALSLFMGAAAFAQSSSGTTGGTSGTTSGTSGTSGGATTTTPGASGAGQTGIPSGWDTTVKGAFFSDPNAGTLLPQDQIRSNWTSLSSEQQAQVRSDCSNMTASNTTGSGSTTGTTGTDTNTTASTTPGSGSTTGSSDMTTGSTSGGTSAGANMGAQMASMNQLCSMIQGM